MAQIKQNGKSYESTIDPRTGKALGANISAIELPTNFKPTTPIDANTIGTNAYKLPPTIPQTGATGFQDYLTSGNETIKTSADKQAQTDIELMKADAKQSKTDIGILNSQIANQGNRQNELYQQGGVDVAKQQVDEYTSQIEAEQLATRRQIEDLQKNNPQGLFGGALQDEVNRITRESTSKQADLAILQNASLRRYDTASAIAERKLQAELEPMKAKLDTLKFFYGENKDDLTTAQKNQLDAKIKAEDRIYNQTLAAETKLSDTKLSMIKSANEQNAPESVKIAIQNAKTAVDAVNAAGQYAGNILDTKLKLAQIAKINTEARKADTTNGTLTDQQLKQIDISPQGKKLTSLSSLYQLAQTYKGLVDQYGFKATGSNKTLLDNAYADLKIAYKEAANLGALTGPDVGIIEEAIKPSAGGAVNYLNYKLSGGQGGVSGGIEQALGKTRKEALNNYKQLKNRNTEYGKSEYVQGLISPFAKDYSTVDIDNLPEGEIIQTEDGILLESLGGGNYSPI